MRTRRLVVTLAVITAALSACDDAPTPTPTPTAVPGTSAAPYLLRGPNVATYQRTDNTTLSAAALAAEGTAPNQLQELQQQGYDAGVQTTYDQPTPPTIVVTPFAELSSRAYIFTADSGAVAYFTAESARLKAATSGGTVTVVNDVPAAAVDAAIVLQEVNPGAVAGAPDNRAYVGLARRGRVVIQLFARINVNSTTVTDFLPLFASQESQLTVQP